MKATISPDRKTLTISVDDAEREELRNWEVERHGFANGNLQSDIAMMDFLEPIVCNSELDWISAAWTGDLTDAPMLGITEWDLPQQDDPKVLERWAFMDYQVRSVLEDLRDKGECVFVGGAL